MELINIFETIKLIKSNASKFIDTEDKIKVIADRLAIIKANESYPKSLMWQILTILIIVATFGLYYYAGVNSNILLKALVPGALDSPNPITVALALTFTSLSVILGHALYTAKLFDVNKVSGIRSLNKKGLISILGGILHLYVQYVIVTMAVGSVEHLQSYRILHLSIVMLELLAGFLMHIATQVIEYWHLLYLLYRHKARKMSLSRKISDLFDRINHAITQYNTTHNDKIEFEVTPAIQRALDFFNGSHSNNSKSNKS